MTSTLILPPSFFNRADLIAVRWDCLQPSWHQRLSYHHLSSTRAGHTATRWECCNQHSINAYPTTIFLQPEPATPLPGRIVCNQHGINTYPTTIFLQPEPATLLRGRRVCNQHGINAYPATIFFNQNRSHRCQVGLFATSMASTLILPPSFFNQNLPHRYQVGVVCNQHGINAYPTTIFLQPEQATPLPGGSVCNQHGINAYPATIFFNQNRSHRYQVGLFATSMASMLIPLHRLSSTRTTQHGINAYPTTIFFNQSRPHRYQVGVLYICNHLGIGTHAYVSPAGAHLIATRYFGQFDLQQNMLRHLFHPHLSTRAKNTYGTLFRPNAT